MLHRSRNSGREFAAWNQLRCGPVLTPNISCTKFKIHSAHADSSIGLKHNSHLVPAIWMYTVVPVYASQIKKLRKRICRVEPAPLWASSYTQCLLYKTQDPFSACGVQLFLNNFVFILCWKFRCRTSLYFTD